MNNENSSSLTYTINNPVLENELRNEFNSQYPGKEKDDTLFNYFLELKLSSSISRVILPKNSSAHTQKTKPAKLRKLEEIAKELSDQDKAVVTRSNLTNIIKSVILSGDKRTISSWLDLVSYQMIKIKNEYGHFQGYFVGEFIPKYYPEGASLTYDEYLNSSKEE